jgi:hypothetical protein
MQRPLYPAEKEPPYLLDNRLGGGGWPQSRFECYEEEKISSLSSVIEPDLSVVQSVA